MRNVVTTTTILYGLSKSYESKISFVNFTRYKPSPLCSVKQICTSGEEIFKEIVQRIDTFTCLSYINAFHAAGVLADDRSEYFSKIVINCKIIECNDYS